MDPELGGKWVGGDGSEQPVPAKGYLKPGDAIENELEKIGVLRNTVGVAREAHAAFAARTSPARALDRRWCRRRGNR